MSKRAFDVPNEGTGALNQVGSKEQNLLRNAANRGQRQQSSGASGAKSVHGTFELAELLVAAVCRISRD